MMMMIMLKVFMLYTVHCDNFQNKVENSTYQVVCHINNK